LIIVVRESVPTSVSGYAIDPAALLREHALREVLEIDLMHDPGRRRNDTEVRERLLAPAQNW
jgi:hypothetical protein